MSTSSFMLTAGDVKLEDKNADVVNKIENYLSKIDYKSNKSKADIFINFIIKEEKELYTVDFMVTEKDGIVVLSKEQDGEYYRVKSYNSKFVRKYSVPVTNILI